MSIRMLRWLSVAAMMIGALGCSKKAGDGEPTFLVQMESVSANEDTLQHQVWVRWSLNGKEQGVKKVSEGIGGLRSCPMGQECPPPKGSPITLTGYYGGQSSRYELVRRGELIVVEDGTYDAEGCGPDGCDEPETPNRVFEIPVPKGAKVVLKAVE